MNLPTQIKAETTYVCIVPSTPESRGWACVLREQAPSFALESDAASAASESQILHDDARRELPGSAVAASLPGQTRSLQIAGSC